MDVKSLWNLFIIDKEGEVCSKTIASYWSHYQALKRYFNENEELTNNLCQNLYRAVVQNNSITDYSKYSYLKTWKTFIKWTNEPLVCPKLKVCDGQPKDIYTNEEIKILISKPRKKTFGEIRGWAITCLLVETGIRASSLLNIKREDIDENNNIINLRHTKNRKSLHIMYTSLTSTALKYLKKFGEYEYLFTNEYGEQLTPPALKSLIRRYNTGRGVDKTSIHLYRHYFAKTYLEETKDIYALKKLLGHQSIATTETYLRSYGNIKDIYKSPIITLGKKKVTYMK